MSASAIRAPSPLALIALLLVSLVPVAFTMTGSSPASAAVVASGTADATGATGPRWRRFDWTPTSSGSVTLSLAWSGTANLDMDLRSSSGQFLASAVSTTRNPETLTASVTAGTTYRIGVWAVSGAAAYTVSTPDGPLPPPTGGLVRQHGRVDASGSSAPAVIPARFTPTVSGSVTVSLSWTGTANLNLRLERVSDGVVLATASTTANPEVVTASLAAGIEYRARVTAASGAADYAVRVSGYRALPQPPAGAPNVLIINTDDARWDALLVMPAVRRWFADQGTTFPNAYVSTPSCCPSRAAMLTGQYDHNNGQLSQNTPGFDETDSIQRHLYRAGYLTGHTGKFIHWYDLGRIGGWWDRWNYFKGGYNNVQMNRDGYLHTSSGYSTVRTFDRAVEYAEDFNEFQDSRPWLLYVNPVAPHRPSTPETKYASSAVPAWSPDPSVGEADRSDKPPYVRVFNYTRAQGEAERTQMLRTLMSVDEQVDRLMTRLQQLGELENTMAIFTSDNGVMWGEHGLPEKFVPYKKAVQVPFLIRWPGHATAGAQDARPVANIDVAPTVLAAAGVTAQHVMDGRNIFGGLSRNDIFTEYWLDSANGGVHPTWASIRTSAFEYNVYYATNGSVSFREYYNLIADPYELVNLLADGVSGNDPDTAAIHSRLTAYRTCAGSTCP